MNEAMIATGADADADAFWVEHDGIRHFRGHPDMTEDHNEMPTRAWCLKDTTYCTPTCLCDCCVEAAGWHGGVWIAPNGDEYDGNPSVEDILGFGLRGDGE